MENSYRAPLTVQETVIIPSPSMKLSQRVFITLFSGGALLGMAITTMSLGHVALALLFGAMMAYCLLYAWAWQNVWLRFDRAKSTLTIERSRWPLRQGTRVIPLCELAGVEMVKTPIRGTEVYCAALVLSSGERIAFADGSLNPRHHLEKAERIRALLANWDAALHGDGIREALPSSEPKVLGRL
jgi:hypothetical protein